MAKVQPSTFLVAIFAYIREIQNIFTMSHEERIREARIRLISENDRRISKLQNNLKEIMYDLEVLRTQFSLLISYENGERIGDSNEDVTESQLSE